MLQEPYRNGISLHISVIFSADTRTLFGQVCIQTRPGESICVGTAWAGEALTAFPVAPYTMAIVRNESTSCPALSRHLRPPFA